MYADARNKHSCCGRCVCFVLLFVIVWRLGSRSRCCSLTNFKKRPGRRTGKSPFWCRFPVPVRRRKWVHTSGHFGRRLKWLECDFGEWHPRGTYSLQRLPRRYRTHFSSGFRAKKDAQAVERAWGDECHRQSSLVLRAGCFGFLTVATELTTLRAKFKNLKCSRTFHWNIVNFAFGNYNK